MDSRIASPAWRLLRSSWMTTFETAFPLHARASSPETSSIPLPGFNFLPQPMQPTSYYKVETPQPTDKARLTAYQWLLTMLFPNPEAEGGWIAWSVAVWQDTPPDSQNYLMGCYRGSPNARQPLDIMDPTRAAGYSRAVD